MKRKLIFITGYFGAPIKKTAEETAAFNKYEFLSLDDEIEKSDGRSVLRICMSMGEHEYRNKEYEILSSIISEFESGSLKSTVICCGDGVLNDEMSRNLIKKYDLIIVGENMSADELWENASNEYGSYHAFMHFGSDKTRRKAFDQLYKRQQQLFSSVF